MDNKLNFLQGLVDDIEQNLAEEVNIQALSRQCQLSPWHFQRLFKSLVGDTLGAYIRGRRLTRAARLLLESRASIIDIAVSVGFGSHEAFTRSFKGYFSLSPKEFRRQRPPVMLNEKPVLNDELIRHITWEMVREPEIYVRPAFCIAGFTTRIPSPFATNESSCGLIQHAWMRLFATEKSLPGCIPHTYYGLTFSESGQFTEPELVHIAAVEVTEPTRLPDEMMPLEIPSQQVAVFDVASIDVDTVNRTIDYIYGYWLPRSGYNRGPGSDYEWMVNVQRFEPGVGSRYVIPVTEKTD